MDRLLTTLVSCLLALATLGTGSLAAQDIFGDGQNVCVTANPYFVAFGHLDSDNFLDLLCASDVVGVNVRLGNGVGTFSETGCVCTSLHGSMVFVLTSHPRHLHLRLPLPTRASLLLLCMVYTSRAGMA